MYTKCLVWGLFESYLSCYTYGLPMLATFKHKDKKCTMQKLFNAYQIEISILPKSYIDL